jgi:hypothetical protein
MRQYASMAQCAGSENWSLDMLKMAKASGCPGFDVSGRVDGARVAKWIAANADKFDSDKAMDEMSKWKLERTKYDAQRAKLKFLREDGQLISMEDAEAWYEAQGLAFSTKLYEKLEQELPERLFGLTIPEARVICRKLADDILHELREYKANPSMG